MKHRVIHTCALACAIALPLPLVGCGAADHGNNQANTASSAPSANHSFIADKVSDAMEKAKRKLEEKDINVSSVHVGDHGLDDQHRGEDLPEAVITPQGELEIAGEKVDATPQQHAMLLNYRQQIIDIAEAGMDIGTSGATLGIKAAESALAGVLSGKSEEQIKADIKPQTASIKTAAKALCERLPALRDTQQKLAAAMPRFRPYATMTQDDIDDCGKDIDDDVDFSD